MSGRRLWLVAGGLQATLPSLPLAAHGGPSPPAARGWRVAAIVGHLEQLPCWAVSTRAASAARQEPTPAGSLAPLDNHLEGSSIERYSKVV